MLLLLILHNCIHNFSHIAKSIKTLHTTTPFSTFYEMFGIPEHASTDAIKSSFRKQLRTTKNEKLLFDAYNILMKERHVLDYYLKNHTFPEISHSKINFVILGVFMAVCVDLGYMVYRVQTQKKTRRRKGMRSVSMREMYSVRAAIWVKDMVYG